MTNSSYHYTECGLNNVYLLNGYKCVTTSRGKAVSFNDIDGLHKAIGLFLATSKKDLSGDEIRFLRLGMLMSQSLLAKLLGISEQAVHRWENGKATIPKSSESLLRLLYREHAHNKDEEISTALTEIANLDAAQPTQKILLKDTRTGWRSLPT